MKTGEPEAQYTTQNFKIQSLYLFKNEKLER
jgi:hypothetical protein